MRRVFSFATTSDLAAFWRADRKTVRSALATCSVNASSLHVSPHYEWVDAMRKIEKVSALEAQMFLEQEPFSPALTVDNVANMLGVSTQTVRNYATAGRIHAFYLTPRAVRYRLERPGKHQSEENIGAAA